MTALQHGLFAENLTENPDYLTRQLITYIGNKRSLLPMLGRAFEVVRDELGGQPIDFLDLFSGSGVVGRFARQYARHVTSNDLEPYCGVISRCYQMDEGDVDRDKLRTRVEELHHEIEAELTPGFLTELYAPANESAITSDDRVFYTRRNAMYLDTAIRKIHAGDEELKDCLLAPLMSSASVHVNTSGVFKGFYKNRDGVGQYGGTGRNALTRILADIRLDCPVVSSYRCSSETFTGDARETASLLDRHDFAYLDPPYNQHPYGSNYFMLNLIADGQAPGACSRVSGIPEGWNRSPYNKRSQATAELFTLIEEVDARFIGISYSSEGFVTLPEFVQHLEALGDLRVFDSRYNTFRGCRNLVNRDAHVTEYLFLLRKTN